MTRAMETARKPSSEAIRNSQSPAKVNLKIRSFLLVSSTQDANSAITSLQVISSDRAYRAHGEIRNPGPIETTAVLQ